MIVTLNYSIDVQRFLTTLSPKGAIASFGSQIHPARQDGIDIWVHVDQIFILRVLGGFCLQYFQNKFLKNIQLFKIQFLKKPWCCVGGRV